MKSTRNCRLEKVVIFISILFLFLFIHNSVQAAGVDGTTIVLNPRTWWNLDRLCKWAKRFSRKKYYFKNC